MKDSLNKLSHLSIAACASFSLLFVIGCGKEEVAPTAPVIRPIKMFTVESGGLARTYEYPGQVQPHLKANLAFEVPGRIITMPVKEGQAVKEGDILATLDPRDYQAKLAAAEATLKEALSGQRRDQALFDKDAGSKETLEKSIRTAETAQSNLDIAQKAFEDTSLKAPFSGTVARILVDDFKNLQAKEDVLVLQNTSSFEAVIDIPETIWIKANAAQSLEAATAAVNPRVILTAMPDITFPARISETATTADTATRTFAVTFVFSPEGQINVSSGMTAKVIFTSPRALTAKAGGIAVPVESVAYDAAGDAFIWRISSDSFRAEKVPVEAGEIADALIEVYCDDLKPGDLIARSGVQNLRDGMVVKEWKD